MPQVATSYDITAKVPIDKRLRVQTIAQRDALANKWGGMEVFVRDLNKWFRLLDNETTWIDTMGAAAASNDFYFTTDATLAGGYTDFATLYAAMTSKAGMKRLIVCSNGLTVPVGDWNFENVEITSLINIPGTYTLAVEGAINNPRGLSGRLTILKVNSGVINLGGYVRIAGVFSFFQYAIFKVLSNSTIDIYEDASVGFDVIGTISVSVNVFDSGSYYPSKAPVGSFVYVFKKSTSVHVGSKPLDFLGTLTIYADTRAKHLGMDGISGMVSTDVQAALAELNTKIGAGGGGGGGSTTALYVHPPVADVAALKALDTTSATTYPDRWIILVESQGAIYRHDRESAAVADDDLIIETTIGRFIKVSSSGGGSTVEFATNAEELAGTEAAKASTPAGRQSWWTFIKGIPQTIAGIWTFATSSIHSYLTANTVVTVDADKKLVSTAINNGFNLAKATSSEVDANKVVVSSDTRLSDARTPLAHTHSTSSIAIDPSTVVADRILTFNLKKILTCTIGATFQFTLAGSGNVVGVPILIKATATGSSPTWSTPFQNIGGVFDPTNGAVNYIELQFISQTEVLFNIYRK